MNIERDLWGQKGTRGRETGDRPKLNSIKKCQTEEAENMAQQLRTFDAPAKTWIQFPAPT